MPNFSQGPLERSGQVGVDVVHVFHDMAFVAIPGEQRDKFLVIHASVYRRFGNLESVDVNNWQYSTGLLRINVLVTVPCSTNKN